VRKVETVQELDALPPYTLIQEYNGFKRIKVFSGKWLLAINSGGTDSSEWIELPATVLYDPSEAKAK